MDNKHIPSGRRLAQAAIMSGLVSFQLLTAMPARAAEVGPELADDARQADVAPTDTVIIRVEGGSTDGGGSTDVIDNEGESDNGNEGSDPKPGNQGDVDVDPANTGEVTPTDPEDPADPEDPEDPDDPVNPEDPDDPDNPDDPDDPIDPDDPDDPIDPDDPEDPIDPDDPEDPIDPENPDNPDDPDDPICHCDCKVCPYCNLGYWDRFMHIVVDDTDYFFRDCACICETCTCHHWGPHIIPTDGEITIVDIDDPVPVSWTHKSGSRTTKRPSPKPAVTHDASAWNEPSVSYPAAPITATIQNQEPATDAAKPETSDDAASDADTTTTAPKSTGGAAEVIPDAANPNPLSSAVPTPETASASDLAVAASVGASMLAGAAVAIVASKRFA